MVVEVGRACGHLPCKALSHLRRRSRAERTPGSQGAWEIQTLSLRPVRETQSISAQKKDRLRPQITQWIWTNKDSGSTGVEGEIKGIKTGRKDWQGKLESI